VVLFANRIRSILFGAVLEGLAKVFTGRLVLPHSFFLLGSSIRLEHDEHASTEVFPSAFGVDTLRRKPVSIGLRQLAPRPWKERAPGSSVHTAACHCSYPFDEKKSAYLRSGEYSPCTISSQTRSVPVSACWGFQYAAWEYGSRCGFSPHRINAIGINTIKSLHCL
jgi:hypothetical protein